MSDNNHSSSNDNYDDSEELQDVDFVGDPDAELPPNCTVATIETTREYALALFDATAIRNNGPVRPLKHPEKLFEYLSLDEVKSITLEYCNIDEKGRLHFNPELVERAAEEAGVPAPESVNDAQEVCRSHTAKMFDALMTRIFSNIMLKLSRDGLVEVAFDDEKNTFAFRGKLPQQALLALAFSSNYT